MRGWFTTRFRAAIAAAATLTGKRFGLLVASSVVATSAIVAAAATNQPEASPLAALLGHSLAADRTPVAAAPAPAPEPEEEAAGPAESVAHEASPEPEPAIIPTPAPEPVVVPAETAPEPTPEPEPEVAPEEPEPTPTVSRPEAGRIKHVFLISLVSSGYQAAFGATGSTMPYLSGTLRPKGLLLTNYSVLDDAVTPNAIATLGGQPPNAKTKEDCPVFTPFPSTSTTSKAGVVAGEGCVYPVETETLASQLGIAQFTWKGYFEAMANPTTGEPENCVYPASEEPEVLTTGGYSARLNPFTHFHSLLDVGECSTGTVPITELKKDLKSEAKTPNFSYISPDLCKAGVTGQCPEGAADGAAAADEWLAEVVPEILESPAYKKDGLLIVTFAGINPPAPVAEGETPPPAPADPLKTGAVLVSKFITKGSTDAAPYNPYSLLRSSEELFGLGQLAKAGDKTTKTFAPELLGESGGASGKKSGGD
ncbi:MAG TPA: alkaline phosphatase family protein [Solirubrobacterales bacterium]|nr:alkaline phosphatase family protein [Solirubrobacterales bacterium]